MVVPPVQQGVGAGPGAISEGDTGGLRGGCVSATTGHQPGLGVVARRHSASLRSDVRDLQDLNINTTSLSPELKMKTCLLFKWSKLLILAENVRI